jgi:hypothetical protein
VWHGRRDQRGRGVGAREAGRQGGIEASEKEVREGMYLAEYHVGKVRESR